MEVQCCLHRGPGEPSLRGPSWDPLLGGSMARSSGYLGLHRGTWRV